VDRFDNEIAEYVLLFVITFHFGVMLRQYPGPGNEVEGRELVAERQYAGKKQVFSG